MRVISCDCFEKIRKELENKVGYQLYELEHIYCIPVFADGLKDETMIDPSSLDVDKIKFCPFCGKKIEISDD